MTRILAGACSLLILAVLALWFSNSHLSDQLASAKSEADEMRLSIERTQKALAVYRETYVRDNERLDSLNRKTKELEQYAADLPDGSAQCLSPADTERLRQLWQ